MPSEVPRIGTREPIADLLRFLPTWLGKSRTRYQLPKEAIPAFVPPPLRAVHAFAGKWPERYPEQVFDEGEGNGLFQIQDSLLNGEDLKIQGDRLVFASENQGNWTCHTLPFEEDPPVWCTRGTETERVCDRLSPFLVTLCLQEIVYGSKQLLSASGKGASATELVRGPVEPVWLGGPYVYPTSRTDIYLCAHRVLLMHTFGWWLGFDDRRAVELIVEPQRLRRIR